MNVLDMCNTFDFFRIFVYREEMKLPSNQTFGFRSHGFSIPGLYALYLTVHNKRSLRRRGKYEFDGIRA